MSRIKDLQNIPNNCINIVDTIVFFFPELKSKYVELIIRLLKRDTVDEERIKSIFRELLGNDSSKIDSMNFKRTDSLSFHLKIQLLERISEQIDINNITRFAEYNERGLIDRNDLSSYESFDDIIRSVSAAEIKETIKKMESQTIMVYEDDIWILVKPLSPLSSKKYGSGTKWCTTSNDHEYFYRYSSEGILIYCINKISGKKIAFYKPLNGSSEGISFWDERDKRIDSIETGLPTEIVQIIINDASTNSRTNLSYLTDNEKHLFFNNKNEIPKKYIDHPLDDLQGHRGDGAEWPIRNIDNGNEIAERNMAIESQAPMELGDFDNDMGEMEVASPIRSRPSL